MTDMFDSHTHFVSDDFDNYPLLSPGGAGGHDPKHPNPAGANLRERIASHPLTVESVLSEWDSAAVSSGAAVQYRTAYGTDNSYLLDAAERFPDRVMPVVVIDAADADAPQVLRGLARDHGIAGVRVTGFADPDGGYGWLNSSRALDTWAVAEDLGLPVVVMYLPTRSDPSALTAVADVAARFAQLPLVLDHAGWPSADGEPGHGLTGAHHALVEHANIFMKLTTSNLDAQDKAGTSSVQFVRHLVDVFGADRVLWGSDFGNSPATYPELISRALAATKSLTSPERRQVLGGTGKGLFIRGGLAFRQ